MSEEPTTERPRRERLDLGTIAILCLAVSAMASLALPPPWAGIVAAAGIATVVAVTFSRLAWPSAASPGQGPRRRAVEDRLDALRAIGFTDPEARGVLRVAVNAAAEQGEVIK